MNPDQFSETDANDAVQKPAQAQSTATNAPPARGSATDIFGTIPQSQISEWSTVRETPTLTPEPHRPAQLSHVASEPIKNLMPSPVVHDVVFKADASSVDGSDPMLQLLQSSPAAAKGLEPVPPASSQPPLATSPSSGGFTQLLRALNYEQVKPEPVLPPVAQPSVPISSLRNPEPTTSITQLLQTINVSESPTHVAPSPSDPTVEAKQSMVMPSSLSTSATEIPVQAALRAMEESRQAKIAADSVPVQAAALVSHAAPDDKSGPVTPVSFTQLFTGLEAKAVETKAVNSGEVVVKPNLPPAEPTVGMSSFTQILQAVGEHPAEPKQEFAPMQNTTRAPELEVKASTPGPVSAAVALGSFTQMFEALDEHPVVTSSPPIFAEPVPKGVSTENIDSPQIEAINSHPPLSAAGPGSFTQMFKTLDETQPVHAAQPLTMSADADTKKNFGAPPATEHERQSLLNAPQAAAPGSFTQMFQTLETQTQVEPERTNVGMNSEQAAPPPGASTATFDLPDFAANKDAVDMPNAAPQVPPTGSFTQMFQSLGARSAGATPTPSTVHHAASAEPVISAPGSFTQMFRTLDAQTIQADKVEPSFVYPPSTSQAQPEGTGSFTQMFGSQSARPSEPVSPVEASSSQAGSFTQMFATLSDGSEKAYLPTQQPPPFAPQSHENNKASQMFPLRDGSYGAGSAHPYTPAGDPGYASPPDRPAIAPSVSPAGGGLTQLLRTLDQPSQRAPQSAPAHSPPVSQQQGVFTSAYGTPDAPASPDTYGQPAASQPVVSRDATQAFRLPGEASAPITPSISAGPSEFTRILNASAFRESALRGGGSAETAPAAQSAPASTSPGVGFPSITAPKMPSISVSPMAMPGVGGGGAASSPHLNVQTPHMPAAPKIPQVKLPDMKPVAPGAGKVQQFLPLLLILIIFLLLAILIAVVFLMKR